MPSTDALALLAGRVAECQPAASGGHLLIGAAGADPVGEGIKGRAGEHAAEPVGSTGLHTTATFAPAALVEAVDDAQLEEGRGDVAASSRDSTCAS
jgi:hypothetical protein